MTSHYSTPPPTCIASTGHDFCKSIEDFDGPSARLRGRDTGTEQNFFREAQFSPDGSSVITHNEDHCLRTFVIPSDSVIGEEEKLTLKSLASFRSASNIQSYAIAPQFDIYAPATACVLCASADIPITLRNAFDYSIVHATYPFVDAKTEAHLSARSLVIPEGGTHFIAGAANRISVFDASRDGDGPLTTHMLTSGRRTSRMTGGWQMCRGSVMAMSISCDHTLAIGTATRDIALYDQAGLGRCNTTFSVASFSDGGTGITALEWTPCGRYLLVAERQSDVVHVFDIRGSGHVLATLRGRRATSSQRLGIDIRHVHDGYDVWAGGVDGLVRTWSNPTLSEGALWPNASFDMHTGCSDRIEHCLGLHWVAFGNLFWRAISSADYPVRA